MNGVSTLFYRDRVQGFPMSKNCKDTVMIGYCDSFIMKLHLKDQILLGFYDVILDLDHQT